MRRPVGDPAESVGPLVFGNPADEGEPSDEALDPFDRDLAALAVPPRSRPTGAGRLSAIARELQAAGAGAHLTLTGSFVGFAWVS